MKPIESIKHSEALKRMRELSRLNIPFSFGFVSCNTNQQTSQGYKVIRKGLLRNGLRADKSNKADTLIAYIDYDDAPNDKNRFFNYPLLMMFNGQTVQP